MVDRSCSGLRIMAAAIGLLLIGGNALPASENTVTTASTRLVFTSPDEGLRLRSLVDLATKREFLPRAGDGLDVWEAVLVDAERKICAVQPGPEAKYATQRDPAGAAVHRLSWHRLDLPAAPGALDVEATIVVPPESALSYWTIAVTNRSTTWGVWHVRFPRFARLGPLGDPAEDRLLSPHTMGQLFRNPYACLNLPEVMRYPSKVKKSEGGDIIEGGPLVNAEGVDNAGEGAHYPGYASFQMCALYASEGAGLYYAAHDGQGYYKQFCFGPARHLVHQRRPVRLHRADRLHDVQRGRRGHGSGILDVASGRQRNAGPRIGRGLEGRCGPDRAHLGAAWNVCAGSEYCGSVTEAAGDNMIKGEIQIHDARG